MDATTVLVLEARDKASATLKSVGMAVEDIGNKSNKAATNITKTGVATQGMLERVKSAQTPLRNLQAILGGFGLSFIGITAATMALRGLVSAAIQNQNAILAAQINMRRWGLTVDDVTRLTQTFSATLGRTAGTTLAAFNEDMVRFLMSFGPEGREQILRWAKQIETASGGLIKTDQTVKDLQEDFKLLGQDKALENLKTRAEAAASSTSDLAKSYERGANVISIALETMSTGFVSAFDPEFHKLALGQIKDVFVGFGAWIRDDWSKAFEIDMSAPVPRAVMFMINSWNTFTEWILEWQVWFSGWLPAKWEAITAKSIEIWSNFWAFWGGLIIGVGQFFREKWTAIAEWWSQLTIGIGDFWVGVWNGMKGVATEVYNWIVDKLNAAVAWANSVIAAINSKLGKLGIAIPSINLSIPRATYSATPLPSQSAFSAPVFAPSGPTTIIIPVTIGDKTIAEIIIDTLTGAVRQRELPA